MLSAARAAPGRGRCVVLGSGAMLDVPIAALCKRFDRVIAIDAVQPRAARRWARRLSALELVRCDLSAGEPEARARALGLDRADLTISANLLSQLPLAAMARARGSGEDVARRIGGAIVDHHLALLAAAGGARALIADVARNALDLDGATLHSDDPLLGRDLARTTGGEARERWVWRVAPRPEIAPDVDLCNEVVFHLF